MPSVKTYLDQRVPTQKSKIQPGQYLEDIFKQNVMYMSPVAVTDVDRRSGIVNQIAVAENYVLDFRRNGIYADIQSVTPIVPQNAILNENTCSSLPQYCRR